MRTWMYVLALILMPLPGMAGVTAEPWAGVAHKSDFFRGWPVNHRSEWQTDFVGVGTTLNWGKRRRWEMDLAHGLKDYESRGEWESGTFIALRWYWRRK